MKTPFYFPLFILAAALAVGCSSDEPDTPKELSPEVSEYLKTRFGNSRMASLDAEANPAQMSFQGMMTNFGIAGGRLGQDSTYEDSIKVDDPYEDPWIWTSCAAITRTENADGSITEVYDYGDGCMEGYEDYQYLMKGKYTQTYKSNYLQEENAYSDDYAYSVVYDNYGGTYYGEYYENGESSWLMDGYSNYAGSSSYNSETETFMGSYTYQSETTYSWDKYTYYYKSDGTGTYNNTGSTSDGSYEYRSEQEGSFYAVDILKPLVFDYTCYQYSEENRAKLVVVPYFTYVSGIESVQFEEAGNSGAFVIDYGDGECDNIVTITENGVSVTVDLSEIYQDEAVLAVDSN